MDNRISLPPIKVFINTHPSFDIIFDSYGIILCPKSHYNADKGSFDGNRSCTSITHTFKSTKDLFNKMKTF